MLSADLACLVVFAVGWELAGGRPGETAAALLLAVVAAAMGLRSTAVRRLGQMSTTYLTSTPLLPVLQLGPVAIVIATSWLLSDAAGSL